MNRDKLSVLPQVTGIRHWSAAEASTVVIDLQDQVQYEAHRLTNPDRIYFDLHDTALAQGLSAKNIEIGDGLLTRVRVAQPIVGVTRVVLETNGGSNFSVSLEPNPYRLVLEVRRIGTKTRASNDVDLFAPVKPAPENAQTPLASAPIHPATPRFRLVLDPGHGGWDLGTVGRKGLLEKDLVLDIVSRAGKLVESRLGAEVVYTRQDDTYIALEKRAEVANQAQADLFVSVHANYSDFPSARGVETYYTNTFSSVNGHDKNEAEPAGLRFATLNIREKVQQSHRFAASIQRSLYKTLAVNNPGLPNRGVKSASYVVLTGTSMPAVLAEVSFVSSPTDENNLQSSEYRQRIAEALYQGIAQFATTFRKATSTSASAKTVGH
jgi:N-acetylmuramoyl-L-alanine amidase